MASFLCMSCEESSTPASIEWNNVHSLETKLARFGLENPPDRNTQRVRRREMEKMQEVLELKCGISRDILQAFKDNDPRPYPSAMAMPQESKSQHVLCGRQFMYDVKQCSCCVSNLSR